MTDTPQINSDNTENGGRARSNANLKPFVKGDARINRHGRPKDFLGLRKLAQQIAHERIADGSTVTAATLTNGY